MRHRLTPLLAALALLGLAGCDALGIESASQAAAKREAAGKAIGAGCRHSARSVEQCYELNKRADKASVFAGWKEMSEYMAENKLEAMPPPPPPPEPDEGAEAEKAESTPAKPAKGAAKLAAKQ